MAIYVLLQCCRCNQQKRLHLYSCSRNKDDIFYNLCKQYHINRYFPKNASLKRILMIQVVYWLVSLIK